MGNSTIFLRPEWTCASYNKLKRKALVYNLIEGQCHYFDGISADVIGVIASYKRNQLFDIKSISTILNIELHNLIDFAEQLYSLGLLTRHLFTNDEIINYRKSVCKRNSELYNFKTLEPTGVEEIDIEHLSAEDEYARSIDGWTNVVLELTYRCSEKCIHCYNIGSTHNDTDVDKRGDFSELTLDEYIHLIDELKAQGMFKICLTGGDPFSKSIIWNILEYLYEKEIAVEIYTNGISIVHNIERLIKLYPKLVGLSIYSAKPEIHDKITRINNSFNKTTSVMEQLYKLGVPLQLKCCVFNINIDSYKSVYKLAQQFAAQCQIEINIKDTLDGNNYASTHLRLTNEQYENLFKDEHIYPYIDSKTIKNLTIRDPNINVCLGGINGCTITPDGDVIPCPAFHLKFGNIRYSSIKEIRNGDIYKKWSKTTLSDYIECNKHDYCSLCAICPGENFAETGSALCASKNRCFMAKKRWEYAVKISKRNG